MKIKLTITESACRGGYHKKGDVYIVDDLCPPVCHELWAAAYPMIYAIKNGALLDYGETRAAMFDLKCPDGGRVILHGEIFEEEEK